MAIHRGECFCGAVKIEVTGEPAAMGYCHCSSCRSWSAGPVNGFTLWNPDAVKVTAGAEHIMTNHPPLGLIDVYAATIPSLKFAPGVHVNYQETVLPMRDGLPKFKDFPKDFGGSQESKSRSDTIRVQVVHSLDPNPSSGAQEVGEGDRGEERTLGWS